MIVAAQFDAIRSDNIKNQALGAAAKVVFANALTKLQILRAVLRAADVAQEDRNKLAHWVCGECPELPNALLLANPVFVRSQSIAQARAFEKSADSLLAAFLLRQGVDDEAEKAWQINKDEVLVYSLDDLDASLLMMSEALHVLFYFRYFLRPIVITSPPPIPPDPLFEDLQTSDGALRRLNFVPLFQKALAHVGDSKGPNKES